MTNRDKFGYRPIPCATGIFTVYAFSGIYHHYDERDTADGYLAQAKALWEMGFDGVKILDGKPKMRKYLGRRLCDPIFDPFYAFLEAHDSGILCGDSEESIALERPNFDTMMTYFQNRKDN